MYNTAFICFPPLPACLLFFTVEYIINPGFSKDVLFPAEYLLTLDDDPPALHNGIRQINAIDWLLGK
jgi:hypothetical protein